MVRVDEIFNIKYGNQFDISKMELSNKNDGVSFISRNSTNNGFVAYVEKYKDKEPFREGLITVTMGGSYLLASFVQTKPFYTAQNVKVLEPKEPMSIEEKLAYCDIFQKNRFKFHSHAREANSRFDSLLVPEIDIVRSNIKCKISDYVINTDSISTQKLDLKTEDWKWFRYDEVFEICKGFYNKKPEENPQGKIPFIGATDSNNGVTSMHDMETIELASKTGEAPNAALEEKIFGANCITVSNNGSVGYAFYQPKDFTCSHDVNPLYLNKKWRKKLNVYISMFLCSLIEKERFRWAYGRKWRPVRMPDSLIKLPAIKNALGEYDPDWQWMEDYIKGLPYSGCLE